MKILILSNNLNWTTWDKKIKELKDWWSPIDLDITLETVNFKKIPFIPYNKTQNGVDYDWFDKNISTPALQRGFDCVIFCMSPSDWKATGGIQGWNTTNNIGIHEIQILARENAQYDFMGVKYPGDQWFNIARHEISHVLYRSQGRTDNTHKWWEAGNLAEVKKELQGGFKSHPLVLLFQRLITPVKTYKYFTQSEIDGLKPELVEKLDEAREIAGIPFIITSGYRGKEKNKEVGGANDSSHLTGLAVDLLVKDSVSGGKILLALVKVGFTRFGFYEDGHIHVDMDNEKSNPCYWVN